MGKIRVYLGNIYHNLLALLSAFTKERLSAELLFVKQEQCEISSGVSVKRPSRLFKVLIGTGTYISRNANISFTNIGKFCSIGPNLVCGWGIHPLDGISTNPLFYSLDTPFGHSYSSTNKFPGRKDITIGNDVFIGANVTILDGVTIGDGAVIGAGAVVSKDVPPYAVAIGCPIRILRYRFTPQQIKDLIDIKWWDGDERTFKMVEQNFEDVEGFIALLRNHKSTT